MKPRQRREWIARYIAEHEPRSGVDVLNQAFVESYIEATGAKFAFIKTEPRI